MIGRLTHRTLDYIVGIALLLAPIIFVFWRNSAATWVALLAGLVLIVYSLFTQYVGEAERGIRFNTHLTLDLILGVFLAISPWLFGFARASANVWLPHLLVGIAFFVVALVTERVGVARPGIAGQLGGEAPRERRRT